MQLDIQARGFKLTAALREHVARRLGFALGRYGSWVQRVTVCLGDVNGPRGGADKLCRILVRLRCMPAIVIKDLGTDLYTTIDLAAERTVRQVGRQIHQRQKPKRRFLARRYDETGPVWA
ncbi:MAG TPA: HPF/RaiA family ribosome-associated protein [Candidatus Competibacteraceae bacterium]|nr:HPF/RaiA family ribosome-associated protein [Candidatus Competibacteraceae bacterium]